MIWAFDVPDAGIDFGMTFRRRAAEAGVLLRPLGNTVYWMPPYIVGESEMEFLIGTVERLLADQE
jgi:adenosylmethionine-8-amino-7-oxononanoate aminotransferase